MCVCVYVRVTVTVLLTYNIFIPKLRSHIWKDKNASNLILNLEFLESREKSCLLLLQGMLKTLLTLTAPLSPRPM